MRFPACEKFYCQACEEETVSFVKKTVGTRRWRECEKCGERFWTTERPDDPTRRAPLMHRPRGPMLPFGETR